MRRLIIEGSIEEFKKLAQDSSGIQIQKVKTFEILHVLRFDTQESAAICKLVPQNPSDKPEDIYVGDQIQVTPLEREEDGAYICFAKTKPQRISQDLIGTGVYFSGLGEIRDGKVKIGLMGETKQLKAFISFIEKAGVHLKVLLLTDRQFSPTSPLGSLTEKQRNVLDSAFEQGYYSLPRRTSSQALAKKLGMRSSTLIEHRRKAEYRLLASILNR